MYIGSTRAGTAGKSFLALLKSQEPKPGMTDRLTDLILPPSPLQGAHSNLDEAYPRW